MQELKSTARSTSGVARALTPPSRCRQFNSSAAAAPWQAHRTSAKEAEAERLVEDETTELAHEHRLTLSQRERELEEDEKDKVVEASARALVHEDEDQPLESENSSME